MCLMQTTDKESVSVTFSLNNNIKKHEYAD